MVSGHLMWEEVCRDGAAIFYRGVREADGVPVLMKVVRILMIAGILLTMTGVIEGVQPYQPVYSDPVTEPWRWQSFPELNGLGLRCMAEGKDGAMWFGTDEGVWTYNGIRWKNYTNKNGLLGKAVTAICVARDGSVYAGTAFGISRFDGVSWRRVVPAEGYLHWPVYDLEAVSDGSIWAGTARGALRLDGEDPVLYTLKDMAEVLRVLAPNMRFVVLPETIVPRTGTQGTSFYAHPDYLVHVVGAWPASRDMGLGKVPVTVCARVRERRDTAGGLQVGDVILSVDGHPADRSTNRAMVFDPEAGAAALVVRREGYGQPVQVRVPREGWRKILPDFAVYDVYEDREGRMWFGIYNGDIVCFDGEEKSGAGWRLYAEKDGLEIGWRPSILQSRDGAFWVVSDDSRSEGNRFDGQNWSQIDLPAANGNPQNTCLLETLDGRIWIGGVGVLYAYSNGEKNVVTGKRPGREDWKVYRSPDLPLPKGARIISPLETSDGAVWLAGLGKEATRLDYLTGRWTSYRDLIFQCETPDGSRWFLSYKGVVRRYPPADSGVDAAWMLYGTEDGLIDMPTRLLTTPQGVLWASGSHGGEAATARFDGERWLLQTHPKVSWGIDPRAVYAPADGSIWFGSAHPFSHTSVYLGGMIRFDGTSWTHDTEAPGGVYGIGETADGTLWTGARVLSRFDGRAWTWAEQVPVELTMPYLNTFYTTEEKQLWIGTRAYGAFFYDRQVWTRYDVRKGLADNDILSILQTAGGSVWASTSGGISRFDGKTWTTHALPPELAQNRTMLRKDGEGTLWLNKGEYSNAWIQRGIFGKPWPKANLWTIQYRPDARPPETEITVSLERVSQPGNTALTWTGADPWRRPEELQFSYRMDGGEWSGFSPERNKMFLAMESGDHIFEVRARDLDFNLDPTPAVLKFTVVPPVWRQPWFVGLMAVLLSVIGVQAVRIVQRDRRLQKSNEDLKREMAERERAEAERARLDAQLRDLNYLYRLRSSLAEARLPEEVVHRTGEGLMEVLSGSVSGGVCFEYDGRSLTFGEVDGSGQVRYERPLTWGGRERGRMGLFCGVRLSEAQERALLDETAGQVCRVLEARELEAQLLQSARLVSMGQVAAGVAHELNQPLGAISNTVSDIYLRLRDGISVSEADLSEMMQDSMGMVRRMAGTIDHLRIFSRDTSEAPAERFSVNDVVVSSLKIMGAQLQNHGIEMKMDLGKGLPEVLGHANQMEQVALNLLANARDAVDERREKAGRYEKRIRVQTWAEAGRVILEVEDNGVGVPEANRERLFEPFFTTKEADRGTGLGLSISYGIVKKHGGEIICESREGEGTVFRVQLLL